MAKTTTQTQQRDAATSSTGRTSRGMRPHRTAAVVTGAVLAIIALGGGSAALYMSGDAAGAPGPQPTDTRPAGTNDLGGTEQPSVQWLQRCAPAYPAKAC